MSSEGVQEAKTNTDQYCESLQRINAALKADGLHIHEVASISRVLFMRKGGGICCTVSVVVPLPDQESARSSD